jgi:subtilisin family serine protease
MRLPSSFFLIFLLVLFVDTGRAVNITRFRAEGSGGSKRTLVAGARAQLQWTAYVMCSLTFNEISSLHVALLGVYEEAIAGTSSTAIPCQLALSGQASTTTLLVFECDDNMIDYGKALRQLLTTLPGTLGNVCPWELTRDGVVHKGTTTSQPITGTTLWHLDRLDQRERPLNNLYTYARDGSGVTIFIIDTGCALHTDFGGRLTMEGNYVGDGIDGDCNGSSLLVFFFDMFFFVTLIAGHGTHCAGLAGSATYGVAKGATLVCFKVLDCYGYGSFSSVSLALMEVSDRKTSDPDALFVVSMSLAGSYYEPINTQVNTLVNTYGVAVVVAAGNSGTDAAGFSPASAASAMTVAASDITDALPGWSNRGSVCDIAAPGVTIRSTDHINLSSYRIMSGTSMACPITAGAVALAQQHLKLTNQTATGAAAIAYIKNMATVNKIDDPSDAYGKLPLLFLSIGQSPVPQPPPPPPPPPAPPLAPPQSSWAAPFTRPNSNEGASGLIYFLSSPPALALLFWMLV